MQVKVMGWKGGVHLSESNVRWQDGSHLRGGELWSIPPPASGNHLCFFTIFVLYRYFLPHFKHPANLNQDGPHIARAIARWGPSARRQRAKARWFPPVRGSVEHMRKKSALKVSSNFL